MSNIVTQLQRAGTPGVPERLFYMYLPVEAMRAQNPQRGEPPFVVPLSRYFTVRVPFTQDDLQQSQTAAACHRSQFTPEALQRLAPIMAGAWNGVISLIPAFPTAGGADLFR